LKTAARAPSLPYFSATLFHAGPTTSLSIAWQALHGLVEKAFAVAEKANNPAATTISFIDCFTLLSSLHKFESKKRVIKKLITLNATNVWRSVRNLLRLKYITIIERTSITYICLQLFTLFTPNKISFEHRALVLCVSRCRQVMTGLGKGIRSRNAHIVLYVLLMIVVIASVGCCSSSIDSGSV